MHVNIEVYNAYVRVKKQQKAFAVFFILLIIFFFLKIHAFIFKAPQQVQLLPLRLLLGLMEHDIHRFFSWWNLHLPLY